MRCRFRFRGRSVCVCGVFYHNNKLFIFDEIYAKGMTNHNAAEKIFEKGFANKLIVCDSAEPKSINDLRMFGLRVRGARKGPDSIEYGIRFFAES